VRLPDEVDEEKKDDADRSREWIKVAEQNEEIFFDRMDDTLLAVAAEEVPVVLRRIREHLRMRPGQSLTVDRVLEFWLKRYVYRLKAHVNTVLTNMGKPSKTAGQIYMFLRTELYLLFFGESPSKFFGPRFRAYYPTTGLSEKDHRDVTLALERPREKIKVYVPHPGLVEMETFIQDICKVGYVEETSIIALDDDKLRVSKRLCSIFGLVAKKIGKGFGPIQHGVVSIVTSLFLGGHIEKHGQSVVDCITLLFGGLTGAVLDRQIYLENLITKDRGYNTRETSMYCLSRGAHELGT